MAYMNTEIRRGSEFYCLPDRGGFEQSGRPIYLKVTRVLKTISARALKQFLRCLEEPITVRFNNAEEAAKNATIINKLRSFQVRLALFTASGFEVERALTLREMEEEQAEVKGVPFPDVTINDEHTITCRADEYCAVERQFLDVMALIRHSPQTKGFITIPRQVQRLANEYLKLFHGVVSAQVPKTISGCFEFSSDEFGRQYATQGLLEALINDGIIPKKEIEKGSLWADIEALNIVLRSGNLRDKFKGITLSEEADDLGARESSLNQNERVRLNRLILETVYPKICPTKQGRYYWGRSYVEFLQMAKQVETAHQTMFEFLRVLADNCQAEKPRGVGRAEMPRDVKQGPATVYSVRIGRDLNISIPGQSAKLTEGRKRALYALALSKPGKTTMKEFAEIYNPSLIKDARLVINYHNIVLGVVNSLKKIFPGIIRDDPRPNYPAIKGLNIECKADREAVKARLKQWAPKPGQTK